MNKHNNNKDGIFKEESKEIFQRYIEDLGSKNGMQRQKARLALIALGEPAIDILAELSIHPQLIIRWEAVKALSQIKDSVTAPLLINALEDEYEAIRWIAADGLISLGKPGLISLLQALTSSKLTIFLKEGAHYVISQFVKQYSLPGLLEILNIIENNINYLSISIYSKLVLNALEKDNQKLNNRPLH